MKAYLISYEKISPAVLDMRVRGCCSAVSCSWRDIDEDFFEFYVVGDDLAEVSKAVYEYC